MKDLNYITIVGWMVNKLGLKGNELILFALIYGFCQDEETEFKGSLNYISKSLSCSRPTATKTIQNLIDKELIKKRVETINNVNFNRYSIFYWGVKKLYRGSKETLQGGSKETLPNITNIDNTNNKRGVFKIPSISEVKDYCTERNNNVDPESFIDFYSSKGWKVGNTKMKDWKACIRTWEKRDKTNNTETSAFNDFDA